MSDAILFFDECESLFAQRSAGGSTELTELLTEIERHDGMIFLATNRPFDLDEAMQRRITSVFEFRAPNHIQVCDFDFPSSLVRCPFHPCSQPSVSRSGRSTPSTAGWWWLRASTGRRSPSSTSSRAGSSRTPSCLRCSWPLLGTSTILCIIFDSQRWCRQPHHL